MQTGPVLTANPYGRLLAAAAHPGTAPEALPHLLAHAPAKLLAVSGMAAGYALTTQVGRIGAIPAGGLALLLLGVAIFILTRPSPRPRC